MFTKKLTDLFSADLLDTVRGVLGEAKKCPADCECEKCEKEEEDDIEEGYVPTSDEPTEANKKTADKVRALLAKEKKPVKEEIDDALEAELKAQRQTKKSVADAKKKYGVKEEAEQIDELSKKSLGSYLKKATADDAGRPGMPFYDRAKGRGMAARKIYGGKGSVTPAKVAATNEEAEQIDELSKATMGRYINKAAERMSTQGVTAGLKIAADEKSKKNFDNIKKREKGIARAVNKLTKEEQEFIDALNADTLDEARGRPKKAGGKDFTIHPKTKEKLMHNNPEHMKKIEKLQKHGVLPKPKTEAGQHIINQLQKAKTSMTGGSTIHFTHGDSKHVSGAHAAKLLDKYAGMKPNEKEDFQKKIGHSHEQLMKHV